jgi:hypothetical protein
MDMSSLSARRQGALTPADRRDVRANHREAALEAREEDVADREEAEVDRASVLHRLLTDADRRDDRAAKRDLAADKRELAPELRGQEAPDVLVARGFAVLDRADSRNDRAASKQDRSELVDVTEVPRRGPDSG